MTAREYKIELGIELQIPLTDPSLEELQKLRSKESFEKDPEHLLAIAAAGRLIKPRPRYVSQQGRNELSIRNAERMKNDPIERERLGNWKHQQRLARIPTNDLTKREQQVVDLLREGKTRLEVARVLGVGILTVSMHTHNIFKKVGVRSWKEFGIDVPLVRKGRTPGSRRDLAERALKLAA